VNDSSVISNRKSHVKVKVGGDFACFSRPEFKVERVTYPVMTPSAARGLLESIFWRPEFRYEIREIHVLRPIREFAVMRNEISDRQGSTPIVVEEKRQQRTSLILRDIEYLIFADMVLREYVTDHLAKYLSQFERRVEKGRCYMTPYLGTREFAAWFDKPSGDETPISESRHIGTMLFDLVFKEDPKRKDLEFLKRDGNGKLCRVWGYAEALFFDARLEDGILKVPREKYGEFYELEGDHA
jgi:CRISPR-associated protein Cas5d